MTAALPRLVLWRVLWRSLFIQAGFNPTSLQSLGFLYALLPALRRLYPDPQAQAQAAKRHLSAFNTHPYASAAIVGGALALEERVARGELPPERVEAFKSSLMGPLAALADGFFWHSLRPAVGAVAAALVPIWSVWAAVFFLLAYNAVHLTFRATAFLLGYRLGDGLVEALSRAHLPVWGDRLRAVAAMCAGGLSAWLSVAFGEQEGGPWALPLTVGCLALGFGAFVATTKRVSPYVVLYAAALLALLTSALV